MKRPGTHRDEYVPKHPSPVAGVPEFVAEPATGVVEGEALAAIRAKRPTDQRIAHIERRLDEAVADAKVTAREVTDIRIGVGELRAEVRTLAQHVVSALSEGHKTERVRIGSRAKVIVGVASALGVIAGAVATVIAGGCS